MEELTIDKTPVKNEKDQEAVIEAVLFTMGGAVELKQLAVSIGQDKETAKAAVDRLMKRYKTSKHGMEILQLEDSYQMCTQSKYYSNLIRIASAPKKQVLSDVVLETLSIIAYRQPFRCPRPAGPFCHHRRIYASLRHWRLKRSS